MITTREAMEAARARGLRVRLSLVFASRDLEWFSALVMLAWGVTLVLPGNTLAGPQYASFGRFGITEPMWAFIFGTVGAVRLVALYINGNWPKTPHIRMAGSLFGAVSWAQISWLLTESTYMATGVLNTGTGVYALFAIVDLLGIARAGFDARYHR